MSHEDTPVVCIVGRSGSGKTRLLERLIAELKARGLRVAVVKHHVHGDFDVDREGKDTWRFTRAGADAVAISSPVRFALIERTERDRPLDEILETLAGRYDLVLTEGFRTAPHPKIEVLGAAHTELLCPPEQLLAVVGELDPPPGVHRFDSADIAGVADLIARYVETGRAGKEAG